VPYRSQAQSAYIHAKASEGSAWAKKFVADSHGSHVPHVKHVRKVKRHKRKIKR
jgi:hypothetical protein